ncbi:MAG TPA: serine hydrolase domain-containing protein [Caldimonas sp.]|nr:serine hydrolase domain-containing protein [Caldimonas sp.]
MMPDPRAAGFDAARLGALVAALRQRVETKRLPGAVIHVERRGVVAARESVGWRDPALGAPMRDDAIFRIHSMSKPIVSVAAMRLLEQGRLRLDDPVALHLPEFAATRVLVEGDGEPTLVAPARAMTIQDLLRHTAGLSYEFLPPSPVRRLYILREIGSRARSNAELVATLADLPLQREPGSAWEYSRAIDVLGRLVEVLAGRTLGEHLRETLFAPLGMVDTGFHVPRARHDRLAEAYALDPDTREPVVLKDVRAPVPLESGGGGLVSTAADYARFLRLLIRGGSLDGARVLGRKTVEFMTSDHLGAIPVASDLLPPGHGFGLGFAVRLGAGIAAVPGSPGTYGWGGSAGTVFFVDPHEELFALMMIQAPGQREEFQQLFRNMVYAAIDA